MKSYTLKSYAKINLFLKVGRKLKKKILHNIQSLVFLINLSDEIVIKKIASSCDKIKFIGKFKKNITNNTITSRYAYCKESTIGCRNCRFS